MTKSKETQTTRTRGRPRLTEEEKKLEKKLEN